MHSKINRLSILHGRIYGRSLLVAILDSIYTFRNGRPCESFAYRYSDFTFSKVMSYREEGKEYESIDILEDMIPEEWFERVPLEEYMAIC